MGKRLFCIWWTQGNRGFFSAAQAFSGFGIVRRGLLRLNAGDFFADQGNLRVDCLTGLLEFTGDIRGSFTIGEVTTDELLLLCEFYSWMIDSQSGHIL